jgi:hypothetical protein
VATFFLVPQKQPSNNLHLPSHYCRSNLIITCTSFSNDDDTTLTVRGHCPSVVRGSFILPLQYIIHSTRAKITSPSKPPKKHTYHVSILQKFKVQKHKKFKVQSSNPSQKWAYTKADFTPLP